MAMYVTPGKFKTLGFGMDLDGIEDFELAAILNRASAIAEGYCSVPRLPQQHSFFGGTISTDNPEQHPWRVPQTDFDAGQRRIYPYHWPIKEVTQFQVKVTNTQYVSIAPTEIFINNTERYVEVVSLAFTGVGLFGAILPSLGLMRPVAELAYTYGFLESVAGERLYPTDARTYRAQSQFWDTTVTPKIYLNGALQGSGYTVDATEGTVMFATTQNAAAIVTADYDFKLPSEIRDAVGIIATHLLGEREIQTRGMEGVDTIKVGEVTLSKRGSGSRLSSQNIAYIEPEAAWLLDGFKAITVRG